MQDNKPLAFYSRKLTPPQKNYTTAEKELLSIVETLKEFRDILLGQSLVIHTVFGEKPSPGFICNIKDSIIEDGKSLRGSCCLDAPFELTGDDWLRKYDCSMDCNNPGPYFAGMSPEACPTFCLASANCTELQVCINKNLDWANAIAPPLPSICLLLLTSQILWALIVQINVEKPESTLDTV